MINKSSKQLGIALIVSGPSGAGKSTVYKGITKFIPDIYFSISCTTRKPRLGEVDCVDYYFISIEEFKSKIAENAFIEYAEVHGNFYGTLKSEIIDKVSKGIDVLLDIDVQGAVQIKKVSDQNEILSKSVELVFIAPPSYEELEKRLRSRGTETDESLNIRLTNAKNEMNEWKNYSYYIINDKIDDTVNEMVQLINALHKSTKRMS